MSGSRRRVIAALVGLASVACTAACGLVIGLSDHEAYLAEGGAVDATQDVPPGTDSGVDAPSTGDAHDAANGDATGDAVQDAASSCDASMCGDACVDFGTDNSNCGACGVACEGGTCYGGTCGGAGVTGLTAGQAHACALLKAGEVWCWGSDEQAQILGPTGASSCPAGPCRTATRIPVLPRVVQISAGGDQTCALDANGAVWCWGANAQGGLGHAPGGDPTCTTPDASVACNAQPAKVAGLPGAATSVSSGQLGFACAVVGTDVYCWGDDAVAELGPGGDGGPSAAPVLVTGNATQVAAGYSHACALVAGAPECWGSNVSGELGHAPGSGDSTCAGSTPCNATPQAIAVSGATSLHAGFHASCFTTSGVPYCLGANDVAQLGQSSFDTTANATPAPVTAQSSIVSLDLGFKTACVIALSTDYCWGDDQTRQTAATAPGSCAGSAPCSLNANPVGLVNVVEARTGQFASYARTSDGKVWAWGANGSGQLGHPTGDGGDVGGCDPAVFPGGTLCNASPTQVVGLP